MYLTEKDQEHMIELMLEYIDKSDAGRITSVKLERLMNELFSKYFDPLILGIIHMPKYTFWSREEIEDLMQEGRIAVIQSIHKQQWDPQRGTIFNFFTTVIIRSLINHTRKKNKSSNEIDIDVIYNNFNIQYNQDFNRHFLMEDIFQELKNYFHGKKKFLKLTKLLEQYYYDNLGKKFIKKHFIEYAKAYNLSPAITNTFFSYMKNMMHSKNKETQLLLNFADEDFNG